MAEIGIKFDNEKPRWELLPLGLIEDTVKVLTFGSRKYKDNNWKIVNNARNRYYSALMRHLVAYRKGEIIDPETGLSHLAHATCNLVFLHWFDQEEVYSEYVNPYTEILPNIAKVEWSPTTDDRPKHGDAVYCTSNSSNERPSTDKDVEEIFGESVTTSPKIELINAEVSVEEDEVN